jgi:hypothetical protein
VTIEKVEVESIGSSRDKKPVVYFAGKEKGLVLNKTNAKRISEIAGSPETEDWSGIKIVLFATETEFAGETVECVRVRAMPKATVPSKPEPVKVQPPDPEPSEAELRDDFVADDSDVPFSITAILPALLTLGTLIA